MAISARTLFQKRTRIISRENWEDKLEAFVQWKQRHLDLINFWQCVYRYLAWGGVRKLYVSFYSWKETSAGTKRAGKSFLKNVMQHIAQASLAVCFDRWKKRHQDLLHFLHCVHMYLAFGGVRKLYTAFVFWHRVLKDQQRSAALQDRGLSEMKQIMIQIMKGELAMRVSIWSSHQKAHKFRERVMREARLTTRLSKATGALDMILRYTTRANYRKFAKECIGTWSLRMFRTHLLKFRKRAKALEVKVARMTDIEGREAALAIMESAAK